MMYVFASRETIAGPKTTLLKLNEKENKYNTTVST